MQSETPKKKAILFPMESKSFKNTVSKQQELSHQDHWNPAWNRHFKHPAIPAEMYWKILPPRDIEDAEEKQEIHNYAIKDCEVQVQIVDTEISIKFDPLAIEESNLSAKKEEDKTNSSHTESIRSIAVVNERFSSEEMCWVMMLLVLPKLNHILKNSDEFREHTKMKEERTIQ